LRQAIARCDRARLEAEASAERVNRLSDVIGEHGRLQAQLNELYQRDQAARGEWIAGGRLGRDPGNAADTRALNDCIVAMQDELVAAQATLPGKESAHRETVARLQAAETERAAAIAEVAVEICGELARDLTVAVNSALGIEATIRSVMAALEHHPGTVERIASIIRGARQDAGVPRDNDSGRRLLAALATDPGAKL